MLQGVKASSLPASAPALRASFHATTLAEGLLVSESAKAPATHPTPSSQGPQASEAAVSGSGPDRHCQPPVLAVGTSSTSPRRAGPWLLNPAPSVPHTSQGQPRRGHPLPVLSSHTSDRPRQMASLGKVGCCLIPLPAPPPTRAHTGTTHTQAAGFLPRGGGRPAPPSLERRKLSVRSVTGAGLLGLGQSVCSEI